MIIKVKHLTNIGKFYDYTAKGDELNWHKNTFLFAPNAYGKSTLVNVLRSLRENDPKLIRTRKTLGTVAPPKAVIVVDGANHVFDGMKWDRPFSNIQIFDVPFIHTNILAQEIEHEHRKNIHKIIIGAKGIKLAEELASLKTKEGVKSQEVTSLTAQFDAAKLTHHILTSFLTIQSSEETVVGVRIQKLNKDIKSKESEDQVRRFGHPSALSAPVFDPPEPEQESPGKIQKKKDGQQAIIDHLHELRIIAGRKLATIHETAEKLVLAHINRNFKNKEQAKEYIRQGIELVHADCPFCGQGLKNASNLLKAYHAFFDDAFQMYQQNLIKQVRALVKWNLDNNLTVLVFAHNANLAALSQWKPFIGTASLPDISSTVEIFRPKLVELKVKVQAELEKKQKDPNADADLTPFDALTNELAALKTTVNLYNKIITAFTEKAKFYVTNLPKLDVVSLRAALGKELEIETRFQPKWKKWATDYSTTKKNAADLLIQKKAKQKELEDYSKSIFDKYQKRINELLLSLGVDFEVTDLTGKTDERANESYSDFGFLILNKKVPISIRQDDAPCFKNTLSEGDKSTLAFAFFIAALEKTPELDKQIVVFDDPLSSLDETRRLGTVGLLAGLSPQLNQLCVFTHKKDFLRMLFDGIRDKGMLQLKSDKESGSRIEPFDMENDRKAEIARLCDDMSQYLNEDFGPTPEDMQGNIRKVFEIVLKTKYYRALIAEIKKKSGLDEITGALHGKGLISDTLKDQLFRLCRLSDMVHHSNLAKLPEHVFTREEICVAIKEAFGVTEKV